jgi:PAS domain S-box-containing protein
MAEQAREMIWEVNAEGLYTYVSRGCELITGYNPDEIVEKMYFYDLHPRLRLKFLNAKNGFMSCSMRS